MEGNMSQTPTTSDQINMENSVIKELTIKWETDEGAQAGLHRIKSTFGAYDSRLRPTITEVDTLTHHFVMQVWAGGQGSKLVKAAKLDGGSVIKEIRVPKPTKQPRWNGYVETVGQRYEAADFLAAVEVTLDHPERFIDGVAQYYGHRIPMNSMRYLNFLHHGCKCVKCGIEGTFFLKQKSHMSDPDFHLNLYAIDGRGKIVLMTRDHIIPKSKGGPNTLDNLQTMCSPCNSKKGDKLP